VGEVGSSSMTLKPSVLMVSLVANRPLLALLDERVARGVDSPTDDLPRVGMDSQYSLNAS